MPVQDKPNDLMPEVDFETRPCGKTPAAETQETTMRKTARKAATPPRGRGAVKSTARRVQPKPPKALRLANGKTSAARIPQSKTAMIGRLLTRKRGCTAAEVKEAAGWKSVSMPRQAKAAGLKMMKTTVNGVTRYHGV